MRSKMIVVKRPPDPLQAEIDKRRAARASKSGVNPALPAKPTRMRLDRIASMDWPPGTTHQAIMAKIVGACGCREDQDCDCVSIFNLVCSTMWYEFHLATSANGLVDKT